MRCHQRPGCAVDRRARSDGRNFNVAAALSTRCVSSVCTSAAPSAVPEGEDRSPDVLDRGVEIVDRGLGSPLISATSDDPTHALQAETDGEEPLDDEVVQVAADAVTVLEDGQPLLGVAGTQNLEGESGLLRETGRKPRIDLVEPVGVVGASSRAPECRRRHRRVRSGTTMAGPTSGQPLMWDSGRPVGPPPCPPPRSARPVRSTSRERDWWIVTVRRDPPASPAGPDTARTASPSVGLTTIQATSAAATSSRPIGDRPAARRRPRSRPRADR